MSELTPEFPDQKDCRECHEIKSLKDQLAIYSGSTTKYCILCEDNMKLRARVARFREVLTKISNFFVTVDNGRFGEFIGAGAVEIAREALAADDKEGEK